MRALKNFFYRFPIAGELLGFFWTRRLWWLLPFVLVLLALGILILLGEVTGVGPLIYTLF